ncbi:MAG: prephenate dehydrogenase/arogenate dehydrogenase family protein [Methanomassiliicoccales archaeon]|nr:prephenate dehydrogenase/arogenate dehydrogenase family protein [Methanomassiliicoccales archaeon]
MAEDIDDLRARIEEIDKGILELVARRTEAARSIGRLKMAASLPLRDQVVEDKVVSRFVENGASLGVSEGTAAQISSILIRESVDAQSTLPKPSKPKDVLVIGGAGKMGSWICKYLRSRGHKVIVSDLVESTDFHNASDLESAVSRSDFIVIATPISVVSKCLERLMRLQPAGVVFDISSIKTPIVSNLKEAVRKGINACSVHPMFGPETESIFNRNIIMCDCGSEGALDAATELMNWGGARMIRMRIEDHDELMAYVLGLSHAVNIAFFHALTRAEIDYMTLDKVASTTFRKQAATSRDVAFENPELYYEIQHLNPRNRRALELLANAVEEIREAASSEDKRPLAEIMENGRKYFGGN